MNTVLSWCCDAQQGWWQPLTHWQDPQPTPGSSLELHAQYHWHLVVVVHSVMYL